MSLRVEKAAYFLSDFSLQFAWYAAKGGVELAFRSQESLDETLHRIAQRPDLGRIRHFRHAGLRGLRSFQVNDPFGAVLVFYRIESDRILALRLIHGSRDLPRRLRQHPGAQS